MNKKFKLQLLAASVIAASTGTAQSAFAAETAALQEVIVTARRQDESVQDVPLVVNTISADLIQDLNIQKFEDMQSVVPGLTLENNNVQSGISLRGIHYDPYAGTSGSVGVYLNDTPGSVLTVMGHMFDVARVEVLRGPQGTLRGVAAPSGSISVVTQRAEFNKFAGYVNATGTTDGDKNVEAAVNVPIIEDKLAIRLAGFSTEDDGNNVNGLYGQGGSHDQANGARLTIGAQPIDSVYIQAMYQQVEPRSEKFTPVESANIKDPSLAAAPTYLKATDRKSVQDLAERADLSLRDTILNVSWDINDANQLNYSGALIDELFDRTQPTDVTNAISSSFPASSQNSAQHVYTHAYQYSHELRLQSTKPLFGVLDYVVGGMYQRQDSYVTYASPNLLPPNFGGGTIYTNIGNTYGSKDPYLRQNSVFGNLTYHLDEDTEVSVGARTINFYANDYLFLKNAAGAPSVVLQNGSRSDEPTIWTASVKHNFTYDLMGYITYGTSWRYGPSQIGDQSTQQSAIEKSFLILPAEESQSVEVGLKSSWLDETLRVNVAAYHQHFDDFAYRSPAGVYYQSFNAQGVATVANSGFLAPVPVNVNGLEIEANYAATKELKLGANISYAKSEIDNGTIPCNDYNPQDGQPDSTGAVPTLAQVQAAAGSNNLTTCKTSDSASTAPELSGTFSAEYDYKVGPFGSYVRGLWTVYGHTDNDPTNPLDDVPSYNLLNLYTGLRDPNGVWETMLFVNNVLDIDKVTSRNQGQGQVSYAIGGGAAVSPYREVGLTAPREIGINVRYNF